jgi:hypothetical protein
MAAALQLVHTPATPSANLPYKCSYQIPVRKKERCPNCELADLG